MEAKGFRKFYPVCNAVKHHRRLATYASSAWKNSKKFNCRSGRHLYALAMFKVRLH